MDGGQPHLEPTHRTSPTASATASRTSSRRAERPYQNDGARGWHAVFAQEQWTLNRLTLQGALRFDQRRSWFPEQTRGPSKFFPTAIVFPATKGVDGYKDITPRLGVAYDVFGNGKTAFKANIGKYLEGRRACRPTTPTRTRRCASRRTGGGVRAVRA